MPELPEVETVCRGLRNSVLGDTICDAKVLRPDSIAYPAPSRFEEVIRDHRIETVRRRGKYILIDLDKGAGLAVHLRMTGSLLVVNTRKKAERFLRVRFKLKSGLDLRYEDMRVMGRLWYVPKGKTFEDIIPSLNEMGIEPFEDLTPKHLGQVLEGKKQPIKSALLDQRVVAGVGNIYADEALFRARIHPLRAAGSLQADELKLLAKAIREIIKTAIEFRGTTLRDYKDTEGKSGRYQNQTLVYGRFGKACSACGTEIERTRIGGRSSHFCPDCQPHKLKSKTKNKTKKPVTR